jgi:hypothetical protein
MQLQLSIVGNRRLAHCSSGLVKLPKTCPHIAQITQMDPQISQITPIHRFLCANQYDWQACSSSDGDVDHSTNESVKSA